MDFTERLNERLKGSRQCKPEVLSQKQSKCEAPGQSSAPLREIHHNTVTTIASTSVDIKKSYSTGNNKVTIETTVTMRKVPKSSPKPAEEEVETEETSCTEGESESCEEKENDVLEAKCPMRYDTKSKLNRLGYLYSDNPERLSSPIHRTEEKFMEPDPEVKTVKNPARSARLAQLAQTINTWEDDLRHIPLTKESQGFSRTISNERIIYDYNKKSPTKLSSQSPEKEKSPMKSSISPEKRVSPLKSQSTSSSLVKPKSPAAPSPIKPVSPVKTASPAEGRYGSPIQMGKRGKANVKDVEEAGAVPTMGVAQLRSPHKPGSVLDRAARYEGTSPTKRGCDPTELPLAERVALFERNAGVAPLPKAPFAMSVPASKLRSEAAPRQTVRPPTLTPAAGGSSSSLHERLALFERGASGSSKGHMRDILMQREREMEMLKHRYDRPQTGVPDFEPSAPPPSPPPMPAAAPQVFEYSDRRYSDYYHDEDEEEAPMQQPSPSLSPEQEKPEIAYPVLKDVKKIKLSPPKPGHIYPCLEDMEVESSETHESDNNRYSSSSNGTTDSDVSSLGQNIVNLSRSNLKRDYLASDEAANEEHNEIDDLLDEALEVSSDEATPPKRRSFTNNVGTLSSTSFEYSKGDEEPEKPLIHTVSFYRKQQTLQQSKRVPSPVRDYSTEDSDSVARLEEELDMELKLVEQKMNRLREEIDIQTKHISQASQALNLCYSKMEFIGSTEQVEFEKVLLVATQRRQEAKKELERLKVEQTVRPGRSVSTEQGSLTISNISVPLRIDVVHEAVKEGQCYHLVCLVRCGERVLDTDVRSAPGCLDAQNHLTFPHPLTLTGLYSDFKVTLEVYTMTRNKDHIPHDIKYHLNYNKKEASKLKLTPRKQKTPARQVQSPGGPGAVRSSAFTLAGYIVFSLRELRRTQFTLNKLNTSFPSVLLGTVGLRLESRLSVDVEYRGFLTMMEYVAGVPAWIRRWFLLKGDKLSYWKYPDHFMQNALPLDTIELSACITQDVRPVSRDICARVNTLLLETSRAAIKSDVNSLLLEKKGDKTIVRHLLSADTRDERDQWCRSLNRALSLLRPWTSF